MQIKCHLSEIRSVFLKDHGFLMNSPSYSKGDRDFPGYKSEAQ